MNDWSFKHSHHPNLVNTCVRDFQFHFSAFHPLYPPQKSLFPIRKSCLYFSIYCLSCTCSRMNFYECFCVAIFHHLYPCVPAIFPTLMNIWMIFIGWKIRIETELFSIPPLELSFIIFLGDWVVILEHKSAYLIDTHECQHTQLGFQNQLMESLFIRKFEEQRLVLDYSFTFAW